MFNLSNYENMELQVIQNMIYEIRGYRVMLDFDLATLYQVETRVLKQSVKRNICRFPLDFMFPLTKTEWQELITICDKFPENIRHTPALPFAFTEQGVAMLSSVLRSQNAIEINISIMRAFVAIRSYLYQHTSISKEIEELRGRIKHLEERSEENLKALNDLSEDTQNDMDSIYFALSELASKQKKEENKTRSKIGYVKD